MKVGDVVRRKQNGSVYTIDDIEDRSGLPHLKLVPIKGSGRGRTTWKWLAAVEREFEVVMPTRIAMKSAAQGQFTPEEVSQSVRSVVSSRKSGDSKGGRSE